MPYLDEITIVLVKIVYIPRFRSFTLITTSETVPVDSSLDLEVQATNMHKC